MIPLEQLFTLNCKVSLVGRDKYKDTSWPIRKQPSKKGGVVMSVLCCDWLEHGRCIAVFPVCADWELKVLAIPEMASSHGIRLMSVHSGAWLF